MASHSSTISYSVLLVCLGVHCWITPPLYVHVAPLSSAPPSALLFPSSQSGAPTADKGPSTAMEALTAAQQGMLHAVSLHMSAPHSVVGVPHSLGSYTTTVTILLQHFYVKIELRMILSSSCCALQLISE